MRFSFFSQLLLAFLFTTGLAAQSVSEAPKKLSYVPNQLIAYYNNSAKADPAGVRASFEKKGINVTVEPLASNYLLLTFADGFKGLTGNEKSDCDDPETQDCDICDVIGNPGGNNNNENNADALWPNLLVHASSDDSFNQDNFDTFSHPAYASYDPLQDCDSPIEIPELPLGNHQVNVAILDSGIGISKHQDFFTYSSGNAETSIVEWHRVANEANDYYNNDPYGHGTAMAYLVAHRFVNLGKQDKIRLHSYRVLDNDGTGTIAQVISAVSQAQRDNMDVINMSFGFDGLDCDINPQDILNDLIESNSAKEILYFTSAGNDGDPLATSPQWPAANTTATHLFTVGATACDFTDYTPWDYSNYGVDYIDLMAPGTNVYVPFTAVSKPGQFIYADGTSFASPIAAGVAANYLTSVSRSQTHCLLTSISGKIDEQTLSTLNYSIHGPINALPNSLECWTFGQALPPIFPNFYSFRSNEKVLKNTSSISVTPNPFSESINISAELELSEGESIINLYSSNGALVRSIRAHSGTNTINTNTLTPGLYFLRIDSAEGQKTIKLIKQ